ncbi:hypothetical protein BDZ45DRAFT_743377 [Acephala macrosclerotiorum]|nr:hypothetical protein BDZ45DRAFT_743377 [Acephala macrosclerotiorum]
MRTKKPGNAFRSYYHCMIESIKGGANVESGSYYILYTNVDLDNLELKTGLRTILEKFDRMPAEQYKSEIDIDIGLIKAFILLEIETLSFPENFPLDLIHCILLNIMPEIHRLLGGQNKAEKARRNVLNKAYRKRLLEEDGLEAVARFDTKQKELTAALEYIIDSIEYLGPTTAFWAIPIERYLGVIKQIISLMSNIDTNIVNKAIILEHLNHLPPRRPLYETRFPLPAWNDYYPQAPFNHRMEYVKDCSRVSLVVAQLEPSNLGFGLLEVETLQDREWLKRLKIKYRLKAENWLITRDVVVY